MARNFKHKRPGRPEQDKIVFELMRAMRSEKTADLARAAGVSHSTISKIRTRRTRYPQHWTVVRVMQALGMKQLWVPIEDEADTDSKARKDVRVLPAERRVN